MALSSQQTATLPLTIEVNLILPRNCGPQSNDSASKIPVMEIQIDSQGRSFIIVECGGRSGKLYVDKSYKLPGNKGYEKCVEHNDNLVAPQECESLCGMKAMKAWKKSIKHRTHPLLTYISSGVLTDMQGTS